MDGSARSSDHEGSARSSDHEDDGGRSGAAGESGDRPRDIGPARLVQEGLDHLQQAARETIAAARAMLDVAEELVEDPRAAETFVSTMSALAEAAARSTPIGRMFGARGQAWSAGGHDRHGRHDESSGTGSDGGDDGGADAGGVQRIPVS